MKKNIIQAIFLGISLGAACSTHAATAIASLSGGSILTGTSETDSAHRTSGYDITVGSTSLWLTALGYYDPGNDGVVDNEAEVGIYSLEINGSGNLLASVEVGPTEDSFEGDYRFIDLAAPIQLLANTTYRVMANTGNSGDNIIHNEILLNGSATAGSELTIGSSYLSGSLNSELVWTSSSGPALYLGNFQYSTTIPEPSVALLGMLSLGGLLRRRR